MKTKPAPSDFNDLPAEGQAANRSGFPHARMRRGRVSEGMRRLVRENTLETRNLILPIFVEEGLSERSPVRSMPGVFRETELSVALAARQAAQNNLGAVMLFGVSRHKDATGSDSMRRGGLLDRMVRRVKDSCPDLVVMADLCFCEYTDHGHCGPLDHKGAVDNDRTLENLALQALTAAGAGADILAPSGMMDGQVAAIRGALESNGFQDTAILAYAAKFASSYYGPFREAAGCSLQKGDRKTRRRRYGHGQTGPSVSRHHLAGEGRIPSSDLCL